MSISLEGVVAIPITTRGELLTLPDRLGENAKKMESGAWGVGGRQPFGGKKQFPGGAVEENETLQNAAAREIGEETGLDIQAVELVELGVGTVVDYEKPGWHGLVGVTLFVWLVDEAQEQILRENGATKMEDDLSGLRPRDQVAAQLYHEVLLNWDFDRLLLERAEAV